MKHVDEFKQAMESTVEMLRDAQSREQMGGLLLPVSYWCKGMVAELVPTIRPDLESGRLTQDQVTDIIAFYEEIHNLYTIMIYNHVVKGHADLVTGYAMDIENSLSTLLQALKGAVDEVHHLHPSAANLESAKVALNEALTKTADECAKGKRITFFEVH